MATLNRASLGYLLRHPWQLGLAILGIAIGVAVIVAVDLANESSRKALFASMDSLNGEATHQIVGGPGGIDESVYTALRTRDGLRAVAPIVSGSIRINGITMQLMGIDLFAEREFRRLLTPNGSAGGNGGASSGSGIEVARNLLTADAGIYLSARAALSLGLQEGDTFELTANGKSHVAIVQGVLGDEREQVVPILAIADIAVAQHWLQMAGKLTRIDVKLGSDDEALAQQIGQALPAGTELLSASGRTQTTVAMSDAFMTNLVAMSLLALLVGVFLIYNSVAFAVLQRRDLIGILRALGVTRAEVFRLVMSEAVMLGIVGATLGVMAGIWLGDKLLVLVARTVSDHYFAVTVTDVAIDAFSVVKGVIAGMLATLVAAAVPAMEASSYQPRLAMTRSVIEGSTGRHLPKLFWSGLLLVASSLALLFMSGSNLLAGLVALFLLILGVALCIPLFVLQASKLLAPVAARLAGITGRLAIGGVGKTLSRTGVAIVALAIAVSATIGVSVMVESFRGSVSDWLNNTLQSDIYVGVPRGSLDPEAIAAVVAIPGIANYSTSRRTWLESASGRTRIIALGMAPGSYAGTRLRAGDAVDVWRQFDNEDAILVSDAYAYRFEVDQGDKVELNTARGPTNFNIAAIYQSYDSDGGAIMMSRRTYDRYFDDSAIDSIGLYLDDDVAVDSVIDAIRRAEGGGQELVTSSNSRIRELSLRIFDRTFVITNVLYWLAVGVAIIGILGAMLALQLERTKEFGVLRAIGMTPWQTGLLVSVQTGFIGLLGGIASIPLGLVMAWVLLEVINRRAFGWYIDFSIQPAVLGWAIALSVGAALIGGIYPALRAAHTSPAHAMREE